MNPILLREIESQLSLDTELLLTKLGCEGALGAVRGTARDGKVLLSNAKRSLRERLCADEAVRTAHASTNNSKVLLVAAVVDCIAGAITGVSPITVAVLIVREGVGTVCQELWSSES